MYPKKFISYQFLLMKKLYYLLVLLKGIFDQIFFVGKFIILYTVYQPVLAIIFIILSTIALLFSKFYLYSFL